MTRPLKKAHILVVDDSMDTLELVKRNLESKGYRTSTSSGAVEALKILEAAPIDLVITDLKMPEVDGLSFLRHIRENYKDVQVMMITGYPSIDGAVVAVKSGAEEYLPKPFTDVELFAAVERALEKASARRTVEKQQLREISFGHELIGKSSAMKKVFFTLEKAADSSATILISGESGTGKELIARAVHYSSARSSHPFVPINCGGIPETLLESELFGYVKGAFTGAADTRAGFFQTADGGTIFLDEISETSLSMQVKLLRVLQDKEVYMVGARQPMRVDVRIVAATNKDLPQLIKRAEFREDLYYRLNVIAITIPPLRERDDDIFLLIQHFAKKYAKEFAKTIPQFSDSALLAIKSYYWPGNVRELENIIQRLVVLSESAWIDASDLPALMRYSALKGVGPHRTLASVESEHILSVLASVENNKTKAAEILGIDRKTLREKLRKLEIPT